MSPKDFHHPFQPYDIQQDFMEAVYNCIDAGKVGIFESPTGTGKSLSLICGSLTWLREHQRRLFDEANASIDNTCDDPDWMVEHALQTARMNIRQTRDDFEARLEAVRESERRIRHQADGQPALKRQKQIQPGDESSLDDEDYFLLDDYHENGDMDAKISNKNGGYSVETRLLMEALGFVSKTQHLSDRDEAPEQVKIYFCSRTHSQLSQFVGELERVRLPSGLPPREGTLTDSGEDELQEPLKHLSLGSRKNLCINKNVSRLGDQSKINDLCLELQQPKTPSARKCRFLPKKDEEHMLLEFRDRALAQIQDIEGLFSLGSRLGVCPYYASRAAIAPAEIVTLPYTLLLQRTAREALGIDLNGQVVIIDEAHNLIDTIEGVNSSLVSETVVTLAREALITYLQKFRNRLKGSNRIYVTQIVRLLDSVLLFMANVHKRTESHGQMQPGMLLTGKGVDQIDLPRLIRYLLVSKLARKVDNYVTHLKLQHDPPTNEQGHVKRAEDGAALMSVQNFLMTLVNPSREGQFFWTTGSEGVILQYMLLDPSEHFREIVHQARAIILAGGTMSPLEDYKYQLFPYIPEIRTLSCRHIIPPRNLFVRAVPSDRHGPLGFTFKERSKTHTLDRLASILLEVAARVRGGCVVFLGSYKYLEEVLRKWEGDGTLAKLRQIKPVFADIRGGPVEEVFESYKSAVRADTKRGAMLLSVIGGKLSEGINFSDALGRCVVVVGLPYPNVETPGWKAKLQYLNEKAVASGTLRGIAGREHVENASMRAVNQAIGRVIRHKNDWASILLVGASFATPKIQAKLPGWIKDNLPLPSQTSDVMSLAKQELAHFFEERLRST